MERWEWNLIYGSTEVSYRVNLIKGRRNSEYYWEEKIVNKIEIQNLGVSWKDWIYGWIGKKNS